MQNNTTYSKLLISIFVLVAFFGLPQGELQAQKKKPTIKGMVISHTTADSMVLYDALDRNRTPIEKVEIDKNGKFEIYFSPTDIGFYTIVPAREGKAALIVIAPNTSIGLDIDVEKGVLLKTQGSKENELLKQYFSNRIAAIYKKDSLEKIYQETSSQDVYIQLSQLDQEWILSLQELCLSNKSNYAAAFLLESLPSDTYFSIHDMVMSELIKIYPDNFLIKAKYNEIAASKKLAIGTMAPEIEMPDTNGNNIKLSSFRGKYVVIDFWASWCGPCRKESPNMVKLYETYRDKGLEIFGVSLDQNKENWKGAIIADNLSWTHVSDLKRWQCEAARDYGVQSIPSIVVIDREGRIVAKDLRGAALENKIKELFENEK